jgi:hypothetical protein
VANNQQQGRAILMLFETTSLKYKEHSKNKCLYNVMTLIERSYDIQEISAMSVKNIVVSENVFASLTFQPSIMAESASSLALLGLSLSLQCIIHTIP